MAGTSKLWVSFLAATAAVGYTGTSLSGTPAQLKERQTVAQADTRQTAAPKAQVRPSPPPATAQQQAQRAPVAASPAPAAARPNSFATPYGTFNKISPNVYADSDIDVRKFTIPASLSIDGKPRQVSFPEHTVVVSVQDIKAMDGTVGLYYGNMMNGIRQGLSEYMHPGISAAHQRGLDTIADLANVPRIVDPNERRVSPEIQRRMAIDATLDGMADAGFSTVRTNDAAGAIIGLDTRNPGQIVSGFAGADAATLNLTDVQRTGILSFIARHEIGHARSPHLHSNDFRTNFADEVAQDFNTLKRDYNADFRQIIIDMRALRALSVQANGLLANPGSYSNTHIWAEEIGSGRAPTAKELTQIKEAPGKVDARMREVLRARAPELASQILTANAQTGVAPISNDATQLAVYRTLRAQGVFNAIPMGNEFVDKYLAAARDRFTPDALAHADNMQNVVARSLGIPMATAPSQDASRLDGMQLAASYNGSAVKPAPLAAPAPVVQNAPAVTARRPGQSGQGS